jgi:hypothetical protein
MPTAVEFMRQYRDLKVKIVVDDPIKQQCREEAVSIQLKKYFMMNWKDGTEQLKDFKDVTSGGSKSAYYKANKDRILAAAMGKGAPLDYQLALEWAVLSGKVKNPTQVSVQTYMDAHMGIDCSGFVTNYLCAIGKKTYSYNLVGNTSAASYFNAALAVNDSTQVRQNDLLVFMHGNHVLTSPGHVAVVDSYTPQCLPGGNMRVVEATGADGANPKLLDSMYTVEQIIPKGHGVPCMILVVKRHGKSGSRVAVIRV